MSMRGPGPGVDAAIVEAAIFLAISARRVVRMKCSATTPINAITIGLLSQFQPCSWYANQKFRSIGSASTKPTSSGARGHCARFISQPSTPNPKRT
jgi:hypothetical protein